MSRTMTVDAVIITDGRIVLIKRKGRPFKGYYALPGGYVERDEDAKQALAREVEEETGLIVTPGRMVGVYDDPKRDKRGNVAIAFLCNVAVGKPMAGSDSAAVESFPLSALPGKLAFDHGKIIRDAVRLAGKTGKRAKVLAGGTFNMVHPGHVHFLRKAKELGEELVVVVATDRTVLKNKKKLLFPAALRAATVSSLDFVDRAVIGDDSDMRRVAREERPEVIALGYDQDEESIKRQLKQAGMGCRAVRIGKLKGYSTKKITGG